MDYGVIFKRAFLETKEFFGVNFGWNLKSILIPVLFCIGTAVHLYRFGWVAAMSEFNAFVSYALIPLGGYVFLMFLANLILAPSRILYEAISQNNSSQRSIESIKRIERIESFNFEPWDQVNVFQLFQAACLWASKEPHSVINNGPEYAYLRMLREAWEKHELGATANTLRRRQGTHFVEMVDVEFERENLIKFAEARKMKPPFLFPEERK